MRRCLIIVLVVVAVVVAVGAATAWFHDSGPPPRTVAKTPPPTAATPDDESQTARADDRKIRDEGRFRAAGVLGKFLDVSVADPTTCQRLSDVEPDEQGWLVSGAVTSDSDKSVVGRWQTRLHRNAERRFAFLQVTYRVRDESRTFIVTQIPAKHRRNAADENAQRAMAAWVLQRGGSATIAVGDQTRAIAFLEDLPLDPFELKAVAIGGERPELVQLKVLEDRIGAWELESVFKDGKWEPKNCTLVGYENTEWLFDGRFQQSKSATPADAPYQIVITTYDSANESFRAWCCLDQGLVDDLTGRWDATARTMDWSLTDRYGNVLRQTHRLVDRNHIDGSATLTAPADRPPNDRVLVDLTFRLQRKPAVPD